MKVELLAPAGNLNKLKTAFYFGADACYLGGKNFSLRALSDNFTEAELKDGIEYAHSLGKKVYVTLNIFARNGDFQALEVYAKQLASFGADAVLISDPGVIYCVKNAAPELTIHLSTQANTTNRYAVKFWQEQGLSRVVLARELSLKEIAEIHAFVPEMELEAFIHGAMCISYSGRCLLSDYLDGRESNRGACVQACRWQYDIRKYDAKEREGGGWLSFQEDARGTYVLNSKDLNMSAHLPALEQAGVCSFKIEGRMKSEYYLATVVNAYRRCIDDGYSPEIEQELKNTAHRDYTTAYMLAGNSKTVNYADSQSRGERIFIGVVQSYDNGVAAVEMRNRFRTGERLEILSPRDSFAREFEVGEITAPDGSLTNDAKLVQGIYRISCPFVLQKGDILRKKS